ncbi:MAG: hypothetical protein AAGA60_10840 [Cyanobacteria bacterium P01_E01_bin.42]
MTEETIESKKQKLLELLQTQDVRVSDAVSILGLDVEKIVEDLDQSHGLHSVYVRDKVYYSLSKNNKRGSN